MNDVIERPPRTIMEVYKMLPEGTLAELINGTIYMSPAPLSKHQLISMNLSIEMGHYIRKNKIGHLFAAPYDVYLDENENVVQPDVVVVLRKNASIIQGHIHGVPDLVIEILSKGSSKYDLGEKKDLYERFGVSEYWVIDPETEEAFGYELKNKTYQKAGVYKGKIVSILLGQEFSFDQSFD
jgi:Uma2 family endonuclease